MLLMIVNFTPKNASAQGLRLNQYQVQTFSSPYASIYTTGGAVNMGMSGCISCAYGFGMPFAFNYDNVAYSAGTTLYVNSTGSVDFNSYFGTYYSFIVPYFGGSPQSYPNSICAMTGLQYPLTGVYYLVSGSSPNRVLTVEWVQAADYWNTSKYTNYEIKMYETSSTIEFWYQNWNFSIGGEQASYYHNVGLNGTTSGGFQQIATIGGTVNFNTPSTNMRYALILPNIQLSAQPKVLNFGQQAVGSSTFLPITVCHTGTVGTLTISSTALVGSSDFTVTSLPATTSLSVGQCVQYGITFKPSQGGSRAALFTITTNGRDSGTQTILLNGSAVYSDYTYDSTVLFRRSRVHLGDTMTQWLHLTATGQAPVSFSSFVLTGSDAGQYNIIPGHPVNPLPVGGFDSIGIQYIPTIEGKHVANLVITSNSFTYPTATIALQGTGTLPHIVVTPPSLLLFDSTAEGDTVCKNITIWNPGTDTLRLSANFLPSNDGDFIYTGLTGSDVNIAPDVTKTVTFCFHPLQQGTRQARLELRTNIIKTFESPRRDTASFYFVDIRGNGVPLGVLANGVGGSPFTDSVIVGKSDCRVDTLMNVGDADILVSSVVIGGQNAAEFSMSGTPTLPNTPFLLKARSTMLYTVCGTPAQQGLRTGTATITGTTGGRKVTLIVPLNVYGFKICDGANPSALFSDPVTKATTKVVKGSSDTLCVTITNCGDIADIYTATLAGTDKASYSIVPPTTSGTIAAGGTFNVCVAFTPTAVGTTNATLNIGSGDGVPTLAIPLTGEGTCATLAGPLGNVDAGNVGDNEKKHVTFTITNSGTAPWNPGTPTVTTTGAAGTFTVDSVVPPIVPPNGSSLVYVTFHPALSTQGTSITGTVTWPNGGPCQAGVLTVNWQVEVVQSSVKETVSNGFSLEQSYPNPTQGTASFTFTTPTESEVRVTLTDMTGKLVQTLITGRVTEGEHQVNLNLGNLPSGTYIYMLESGSTKLVRQIILTK
jgi:hypothetical protein